MISIQVGSCVSIQKFSSQSGIFISPVFATSTYQAWFLHIDLSYPEAHCLSDCNCAFSCFLSVSVVPYSSTFNSKLDDVEQSDKNQCRVSIFFQTDCFGEDLAVKSQIIEVSKLQHFGISFKNICPRKELSQKLYNNTLNIQVIIGPTDPEWLHRSRRLGYLFDNIPTAPDIIFCIKGRYLYAHSEIIKNTTSRKFQEILKIHQKKENENGMNEDNSKRFIRIELSNIEFLTFKTILYYFYTNIIYVDKTSNILDLCYWGEEFELNELVEIMKSDYKFRLNIENIFEELLIFGPYLKDIRNESIIFIAKNFPLVQSTTGFKKVMMNLNKYPGARDIWLEITNTIKQLGYSNYLSVPLFKNM
ncbi:hypothetical protein RclHR1_00360004 [Rhizophagus clarus]|uniref:BTB domain-containing protein n=1 Tax=Rhizophagus clarus TaxID=94130 RepID=A0A2Z6RB54_9GLOM|nr:hypothetical protein RclHR1_00360004 [Rhizophagus clarus]GES88189.1 hypothetical protein GLOIN_2v1773547 [Rhizophagus clarus]